MSMFQSNRPDKKCKLLEADPEIIPKRTLAELSTHYDLHLISCNPRILKVFTKTFSTDMKLSMSSKSNMKEEERE